MLVPVPSPAEPPPHAKAHGWRKKNDPNYVGYTGKKWEKDYGIIEGKCNTAAVGFQDGKQACRELTTELNSGKGKKKDKVTGVACRRGNGEWVFKA